MLVAPDTSPREPRLPGDDASWDFGLARGLLRRRDRRRRGRALPHVQLRHARAARADRARNFPARLDARSRSWATRWAATARCVWPAASRALPLGLGVRADLRARPGAVGQQGVQRLPRRRPRSLARPRCDRSGGHAGPGRRRSSIDQGTADRFLANSCGRSCFAAACERPDSRCGCACSRATTTATTSSRPSCRDHIALHARGARCASTTA